MIMRHHGLLDSIVSDQGWVFISKSWSLLCYFFNIKRQNSPIKAYFGAFLNFKQNNLTQFLSIAEFAYNNDKNIRTNHTLFKLNCGYHLYVFYKEDINPCFKSKIINKLSTELPKLRFTCCNNLFSCSKIINASS